MLTRFITSQRDHGGYLCMGTDTSLSLQESWHLPPSSISLAGQTLQSFPRDYMYSSLPSFFPRPPSLSLHSLTSLTFNQRDYEKKWSLKFNCHSNRTAFCMESTTTEGAPVAEGLPEETNGTWDSRKKRQRQKHAHHWQQFTRALFPGGRFPAKFGCQPIKLELYPLAHAYPANYVRVHFRHLGVYKGSRVAHRAIRVRVS